MTYHVWHSMTFQDGTSTAPYLLMGTWRTVKGALRAGERRAALMDQYYQDVREHALVVKDRLGRFITNMAA